jgi:hypothetical protein
MFLQKEINQESFNNVKETDDAIDKTQPEIRDIESLSSVSKTQDKPEVQYTLVWYHYPAFSISNGHKFFQSHKS